MQLCSLRGRKKEYSEKMDTANSSERNIMFMLKRENPTFYSFGHLYSFWPFTWSNWEYSCYIFKARIQPRCDILTEKKGQRNYYWISISTGREIFSTKRYFSTKPANVVRQVFTNLVFWSSCTYLFLEFYKPSYSLSSLLFDTVFCISYFWYSKKSGSYRSSRPEMFLRKGVLKICSNFTGEHPCRVLL